MDKRIELIKINLDSSILTALKQMDSNHIKLLLVENEGKFYSLLSIGDIQRAIINDISLESPIKDILREEVSIASDTEDRANIIAKIKQRRNDFMPIVDSANNIVDVIFWDDISKSEIIKARERFDLPVIIMAGGQGTRLRPLTNVLPKPLIPIGEQTMLEDIMDRFVDCGCHHFYFSVNYKADFIRRYFDNINKPQYSIEYFQEDKPLGTAGSLYLLKDKINSTFFVSNCDIIIDEDYSQILEYHRNNKNEITLVAAIKNYSIPYGTLETGEGGQLISLSEKPDLAFKINTGMYILEPHLLREIPTDRFFHITHLIESLIKHNRKVGVYPINEGSWTDIGSWDEYFLQISKFNATSH